MRGWRRPRATGERPPLSAPVGVSRALGPCVSVRAWEQPASAARAPASRCARGGPAASRGASPWDARPVVARPRVSGAPGARGVRDVLRAGLGSRGRPARGKGRLRGSRSGMRGSRSGMRGCGRQLLRLRVGCPWRGRERLRVPGVACLCLFLNGVRVDLVRSCPASWPGKHGGEQCPYIMATLGFSPPFFLARNLHVMLRKIEVIVRVRRKESSSPVGTESVLLTGLRFTLQGCVLVSVSLCSALFFLTVA